MRFGGAIKKNAKKKPERRRTAARRPMGTVAYYGPDDRTATKVTAAVVPANGGKPTALRRWRGTDVARDPVVQAEVVAFLRQHGVGRVIVSDGIIGCPHEEGVDYPLGVDCPFCPFWKGQRGPR